tara:strand:- start:347 stop:544 length:198 start_codon:yes stop_codon:yes gene_type:complete
VWLGLPRAAVNGHLASLYTLGGRFISQISSRWTGFVHRGEADKYWFRYARVLAFDGVCAPEGKGF